MAQRIEFFKVLIPIIFLVLIVMLFKTLKKVKTIKEKNKDFDKRIELDITKLSAAQLSIKEKFGNPLKIQYQDSINNIITIWIYPDNIISFNEDGSLRKVL